MKGKLASIAMECEPAGHPKPPPTCGEHNNTRMTLRCKPGSGTIKTIEFAGYGDISGSCDAGFSATGCHAAATKAIVEAACVGKTSCSLDASVGVVAKGVDPCPGKGKVLAVVASGCEPAAAPSPTPPPPPAPPPPATGCYATNTQTGNAMALYLDVPPTEEIRQATMDALLADYKAADNHPTFGTVGARIFLPVLAAGNQMGTALDFATLTTQPSYGYMVSTPQMPGTIWEQWGGDAFNSAGSKNHPMYCGGIGVFLYQLAGLHEHDVSSKHAKIRLDAAAVERVGAASGSMETPHGQLSWEWALRDGKLYVDLSVPHGYVTGQLELPLLEHHSTLAESGVELWSRAGAEVAHSAAGVRAVTLKGSPPALVVGLQSGQYRFVAG